MYGNLKILTSAIVPYIKYSANHVRLTPTNLLFPPCAGWLSHTTLCFFTFISALLFNTDSSEVFRLEETRGGNSLGCEDMKTLCQRNSEQKPLMSHTLRPSCRWCFPSPGICRHHPLHQGNYSSECSDLSQRPIHAQSKDLL